MNYALSTEDTFNPSLHGIGQPTLCGVCHEQGRREGCKCPGRAAKDVDALVTRCEAVTWPE